LNAARSQVFDELYQSLHANEGEKFIYILAKGQKSKKRYMDQVRCIKMEASKIIVHKRDIKGTWK
jgi:hypothetical protein